MYVFFDKRWKIVRKIWNLEKSHEHYQTKEFDSNPVYNGKYIKTKTKSYNGKINKNFYNNKIPKEASECICLSVILLNLVYKKDKNYHAQVLL